MHTYGDKKVMKTTNLYIMLLTRYTEQNLSHMTINLYFVVLSLKNNPSDQMQYLSRVHFPG